MYGASAQWVSRTRSWQRAGIFSRQWVWRLSAEAVMNGAEMHKIWLGLAVVAVELVVLLWLVGGHVLHWCGAALTG